MNKIVWTAFPKASRVIDHFHIHKLACDAVQELRIKHRWDAIQQAYEEMKEVKRKNEDYVPYRYSNGDNHKELLIRSQYLLFKSDDKWTEKQKQRAAILFKEEPDIKKAYGLCYSLRMNFARNNIKDAARLAMARWYNKVEEAGMHSSMSLRLLSMNTMMKYGISTTIVLQIRWQNRSIPKINYSEQT